MGEEESGRAGSCAGTARSDAAIAPVATGAAGAAGWTRERRDRFFDHFAMAGDVAAAAAAAGMTARDAYAKRRGDRTFAALWRRALDVGYDRLEAAVIRQVSGTTDTKMDVGAAMLLLERHRGAVTPPEPAPNRGGDRAARQRAERELLRRLRVYAKRSGTTEPA
ncbi:MAG: hypothetical protein DI544_04350 [Sphingomonas taxi]|uniref:Terminase n=1 Tax=Sphingomonas taxi TaxID=1549858 RepID=A0A2W5P885_9SPHN|nr:MAG: hypothetical protein DI544_04350 [Sphingomonas taxi]